MDAVIEVVAAKIHEQSKEKARIELSPFCSKNRIILNNKSKAIYKYELPIV